MKRFNQLIFIIVGLFISLNLRAEDIKPQTQGDVTYVSGGVGQSEADAMQAIKGDYNLHLLFAVQGTGEYLSNVRVNITDSKGDSYLDTVSDGPMLFANLKPGRYIVYADVNGRMVHRNVTLNNKKIASLTFTWPD